MFEVKKNMVNSENIIELETNMIELKTDVVKQETLLIKKIENTVKIEKETRFNLGYKRQKNTDYQFRLKIIKLC